jgi:hypothetical protein
MLTALLGMAVLNACAGKSWFSYTGWEAKPDNRTPLLEGGPHAAQWYTEDLAIHYRYELQGDRLNIEGQVIPQSRTKHFHQLKAWVSIHFLDANGTILETHRLWSQRGSDVYGGFRWGFKHSWELPPDKRAVAFSFTGTAGSKGTTWDFWRTP